MLHATSSRTLGLLVASALILAGLAACGGESSSDPAPAAGGTAGSAGASGTGGTAGSSGTAGAAGEAGKGGSAGSTGGAAGNGGSNGYSLPAACGGEGKKFACVPTTDQGCAGGSQCDYSETTPGDFKCRPEGPPGKSCNPSAGEQCEVGYSCIGEDAVGGIHPATSTDLLRSCHKFCCASTDCTSPDWCSNDPDKTVGKLTFEGTNIGVCIHFGPVLDAGPDVAND